MAEMTVAEAVEILNGSEKAPKDLAELSASLGKGILRGENSMIIIWDSERRQIAALLNRLEAAEKVCGAASALSRLYDGDLDTNKPLLYETWAAVDDALAEWRGE